MFWGLPFLPGNELPGYFQKSLRDFTQNSLPAGTFENSPPIYRRVDVTLA